MINLTKFKSFYSTTSQEVRWWAYAAWTLPIVALAGIFFIDMIGWTEGWNRAVIIVGVLFFTIAVYWWWWAIFKLSRIAKLMLDTASNLKNIGRELREINQELKPKDK